ncbi:MAG: helix-turn-helix transcriptional regulator [Chloroflexaceae bacterium]|nr:helix-turn-helix transcriptional regulator [Chloroflexaceae bacterium]
MIRHTKEEKTRVVSRIAELREATGMTQQQLAVLVGVTTNTIQNWEKGKSGVEQIEKFLKLCVVLDCNLADLVEFSDLNTTRGKGFSLDELRELRKKWISQ